MEKKQVLVIKSALCDAREVREETLAAYEKVIIRSGLVLVSPETRSLLDRYSVALQGGDVVETGEEVEAATFKGQAEIAPGQLPLRGKIFLQGSGTLTIAPGSGETLKNYLAIRMNGTVLCPQSLSTHLAMLKLNGALSYYPDEAVLLKDTTLLDRTFHLRARQDACYFASRRVVALDPGIDFAAMAQKNVRFSTKELLVAEGLVQAAVPLFDERAEVTILPDGCAFLPKDAVLDESLLRRQGTRLYVRGDLTVPREAEDLLSQITFLRVRGDVRLPQTLLPLLDAIPDLRCDGEVRALAGLHIEDRVTLTVDRAMLEGAPEGLSIVDCVNVSFREDVSPQLIREKLLRLEDCVNVSCTEEQRPAIESVAVEVVRLGPAAGSQGNDWLEDMLRGVTDPGREESPSHIREIKTGTYKL